MKTFKLVACLAAILISLSSFAKVSPVVPTIPPSSMIKEIHWRAVDMNGNDITKFVPTISTITSQYFAGGSPWNRFTMTLNAKTTVQVQYYVDITYYSNWILTSTYTVNFALIYVNANEQVGNTDISTANTPQSYGVSSWVLELTNP